MWRILVAVRAGDAFVVIGAAPGVVGKPGAGGRDLQHTAGFLAKLSGDDEKMMAANRLAVAAIRFSVTR